MHLTSLVTRQRNAPLTSGDTEHRQRLVEGIGRTGKQEPGPQVEIDDVAPPTVETPGSHGGITTHENCRSLTKDVRSGTDEDPEGLGRLDPPGQPLEPAVSHQDPRGAVENVPPHRHP